MRRTVRLVILLFTGVVYTACGADPERRVMPDVQTADGVEIASLPSLPAFEDPAFVWSFRVLREIPTVVGPEATPLVFDARAMLDLGEDGLLIQDPTADQPLVLLDPSGTIARDRFGRTGRGPGELGSWLVLHALEDGFSILDGQNRQLHRFGSDGAPEGSLPVDLTSAAGKGMSEVGEGFLIETFHLSDTEWHRVLERVDPSTGEVEVVATLPRPSARAEPGRIQQGRVLWTTLGNRIAAMWSDRSGVEIYDADGVVVREIQLPLTRRSLSERDIQQQIEHYGAIARSLEVGTAALTNEMYTVNDTVFGMFTSALWRAAEDPALPVGPIWWRLFSVRGEYLGVVRLPEDFVPLGRSERGLWARVLDESGYPVIQELQLARVTASALEPASGEPASSASSGR